MKINIDLYLIGLIVTLVFCALKWTGQVDWSWLIIFSPLLAVFGLHIFIIFFFLSLIGLIAILAVFVKK